MKIFIKLPWGSIEITREPWEKEKFYVLWACLTVCAVTLGFFSIFK